MIFSHIQIVAKIGFFKDKNSDFLWNILPLLKAHKVFRGDLLYAQEDLAEEIYFVLNGQFTVYVDLSEEILLPNDTVDITKQGFNVPYT